MVEGMTRCSLDNHALHRKKGLLGNPVPQSPEQSGRSQACQRHRKALDPKRITPQAPDELDKGKACSFKTFKD
ncbi:MAG: hypothetical protein EBX67_06625 [Betaproteobacteria bacterium]|nr:hypothetical protein [Betaproteobacteria bacterium]